MLYLWKECEEKCPKYYGCITITMIDDFCKALRISLIIMNGWWDLKEELILNILWISMIGTVRINIIMFAKIVEINGGISKVKFFYFLWDAPFSRGHSLNMP